MNQKGLTTGQIAKRTGMTIRALRYYDRIGLLKPSQYQGKTRLYSKGDVAKLQKLSVLKFIGLSLEEMGTVMESHDENADLRSSLLLQKQLILQKMRHMEGVVKAIEASMDYMEQQDNEPDWEELTGMIHTVQTERDWGEQYRNAVRLQARMHLYDRFSTNQLGWHEWFFKQVQQAASLHPPAVPVKLLDIGCGDASLWARNKGRIPPYWEITLADASAGMLEDARSSLGESAVRFKFRQADVRALPFADDEFQIVIANHMLYHVEELTPAFKEISRVLSEKGIFFASTMSSRHLLEMEELAREFDPGLRVLDDTIEQFNLYNGAELLNPWFPGAELVRYKDSLVVTEAGPLIRYMTSTPMNAGKRLTGQVMEQFTAFVERRMLEKGSIVISKDMGYFSFSKL
ncbi:MerR family transcriptional regulator [Paenibacillus albidus]|uniref:MerR family transcriptional regulator n=1 Tax=Paenibacillus albidus TaxID=2041023 RepID=UPI0020360E09|nr:methyltransferase domain-containing protein [Paenibacillus albidus]